jgi:DNA polymerase elongation subunit (family B)
MLIYDIETETVGSEINPNVDILKFFGAYEYEDKKYHFYSYKEKDKIKELFKKHRIITNFNGQEFDDIILKRSGLMNNHINIDLYKILKKRGQFLKISGRSFSLKNIAKELNLTELKEENFDYDLLNKNEWTDEELKEIKKYTLQDIKVTKELLDKVYKFFEPFKDFVSDWDRVNLSWLTCSMAVYSYKVICNYADIKEEYDRENYNKEKYKGAFVIIPTVNEEHNDIYCFDFNSLYPHNNIQGNLFSHNCKCCSEKEKWKGNELFKVEGQYCSKKQGKIEQTLLFLYKLRQKYKKEKDPREYALKIVLNSFYGASANPIFKNIYNKTTASDCTLIGRSCLEIARDMFDKAGYKIIYGDTDSIYLKDEFKNKDRILKIKNNIVDKIKENLPFPSDTFDMGIDEEIKHIWFFNKKKKNYMYVTNDGKLKIKGLPMIKRDSSRIGYYIFNKYLRSEALKGNVKFKYDYIKELVKKEFDNNINLFLREFRIKTGNFYNNKTSIQYQIFKKYGKGTHKLISNQKIGVGKGIKYCSIDEFKNNDLTFNDLNLKKMWRELIIFIEDKENIGWSKKKIKQKKIKYQSLSRWLE